MKWHHPIRLVGVQVVVALLLASTSSTTTGTRLLGISWDVEAPATLGVVSVDPATGNHTMVKQLGMQALTIVETAYDHAKNIFYLLSTDGASLHPLHVQSGTWLDDIAIDVSGCAGGSGCFSELMYNPDTDAIVATGVGYANPTRIAAVSISLADGSVAMLGFVGAGVCALTLDASALDVEAQTYYLTADCGDDEHDSTIFAFDVARPSANPLPYVLNGTAYYDTNPLWVGRNSTLYALNGGEQVVRIHNNMTSIVGSSSNASVGGIPANHGVAVDRTAQTVWMSVSYFTAAKLVSVDLETGAIVSQPFPFVLEHLVVVTGDQDA